MTLPKPPKALLFDLGGVLVKIDFSKALLEWVRFSRLPIGELRSRFSFDAAYESHERGELAAEDYFAHLAQVLELDGASRSDIERGWDSIFAGEIEETRRFVERARKSVACFALTNTNASHMATWIDLYPAVAGSFDRVFASHELGLRKPDPAVFAKILELTQIPAEDVVLFDDLPENFDAAIRSGLHGVLVRSSADVMQAFELMGLQRG